MTKFKHKKIILSFCLILVISSLSIFVFNTKNASAGIGEKIANGLRDGLNGFIDISFTVVAKIIATIGAIIHSIVSLFFWLSAMFLELAFGIEGFTTAGVVVIGWTITRDLANMLFVLVLITISLATILRIETYGMKALLPKLIIAALLINFSLVIAGAIIDFSQILTHFFYDEVASANGVSGQIAKVLKTPSLSKMSPDANIGDKLAAGASGLIMMIFSIFFGIILILAAGLALLFAAFFLIVRLIMLWILLILAPLAWFFWIIPGTAHLFQQWWNTFLKWVFFSPIYMFFVYLAIKAGDAGSFSSIIQQNMQDVVNASGWKETLFTTLSPAMFIQFIVIIGLLFGGLVVAQKGGVYGAQGAIGITKAIRGSAGKWAGRVGMRTALKAAPPEGRVQKGLQRLAKIPILGKLATPAFHGLEETRATVNKEKESTKNWTTQHKVDIFDRSETEGKIAIMMNLYDDGDLGELTESQREKGLELAKRYNQEGKIIKAMPSLAKKVGKEIQDVIDKTNAEGSTKIISSELDNKEVVSAIVNSLQTGKWTSNHLTKIGNENPNLRERIQKEVLTNQNIGTFADPIKKYLESYLGNSIYETGTSGVSGTSGGIAASVTNEEFKKAKKESNI